MSRFRTPLFLIATGSLLLGASGALPPAVSMLLWLPSALVVACHPSSPLVRMVRDSVLRSVNGPPQRPH